MGVPTLPGGGMDGRARANIVLRFQPTVLVCTPSYALYLGRVLQEMGADPAATSVKTILVGGEPAMGIRATRERLQELWGARLVEFYGCTEAAPHCGGYSCPRLAGGRRQRQRPSDGRYPDLGDGRCRDRGSRSRTVSAGLTVCTCLNSESSPQLRFLVGDYTASSANPAPAGAPMCARSARSSAAPTTCSICAASRCIRRRSRKACARCPGIGDEYEIVLSTTPDGLDIMVLRVEHAEHDAPGTVAERIMAEVRARCEIRADVEVLKPGTLPKTEFKAKRVRDTRKKT